MGGELPVGSASLRLLLLQGSWNAAKSEWGTLGTPEAFRVPGGAFLHIVSLPVRGAPRSVTPGAEGSGCINMAALALRSGFRPTLPDGSSPERTGPDQFSGLNRRFPTVLFFPFIYLK